MTLSLYIARRFLWNSVTQVFLIFFGILLLVDMIEELRRFSDADIGLARAGAFGAVERARVDCTASCP
jgi:lipopolysaccharide export system permease protein